MKTIKIKKGVQYLGEVMNDLPINCLFLKSVTGAGGTTVALTNDVNYILAMPYLGPISNKVEQSLTNKELYKHEIFSYVGGVTDSSLKQYLDKPGVKKIMTTYDSLEKLSSKIDVGEFSLLVDEFHVMSNSYEYRRKAVDGVLNVFSKYRTYTFMTATPVEAEFLFTEFENIPSVTLEWEDLKETVFDTYKCSNVEVSTHLIIEDFLNNEQVIKDTNLYIFVNSIDFMSKMLRMSPRLNKENTKLIYSKKNGKTLKLERGELLSPPKKITMISAANFESSDIWDQKGVSLIVSDTNKKHTLGNPTVMNVQVAGRIRNSPYNNTVTHLYNTNGYLDVQDIEEYEKKLRASFEEEKSLYDMVMALPITNQKRLKLLVSDNYSFIYRDKEDGTPKISENFLRVEIMNLKINLGYFKSKANLLKAYRDLKVTAGEDKKESIKLINVKDEKRVNILLTKCKWLLNQEDNLENKITLLEIVEDYPWMEVALENLTLQEIVNLKCNKTNIFSKLKVDETKELKVSKDKEIAFILKDKIKNGYFIPASKVKDILQKVYNQLHIKQIAKSTELEHYYNLEQVSKRVDGKKVAGYNIIKSKYKF